MTNIKIVDGTYKIRGKDADVSGLVFPLVEEFKVGAQGGYVTVDGSAVNGFPDRNIKIKVAGPEGYEAAGKGVEATVLTESDAEIVERIRERFDMLKRHDQSSQEGNRPCYDRKRPSRCRQESRC